jgi:hypothetical protein
MKKLNIIAFFAALFSSGVAFSGKAYQLQSIMLLQPDFILAERLESTQNLADYIENVEKISDKSLASIKSPKPTSGFIVFALRPGGKSKVWFDLSPSLPSVIESRFRADLEAIAPAHIKNNVVIFAVNVSLWGASPSKKFTPSPIEWKKAFRGSEEDMEIDKIVDRIWPAK